MLCDKCKKNNATTHIRTVINGVVTEKNLCGYCAASEGYSAHYSSSIAGMLSSILGDLTAQNSTVNETRCPVCNSSFSDIAESGRVGCSECYNTFKKELLPYLKRVHGSTKHIGKTPMREQLIVKPKAETVDELRMELNRLVGEEKFEEAAVIRDRIKEAEAKNNE